VSGSERAGEFGLAGEQADFGLVKEDRCSETRGITPGVERSCAQALALLRDQRRRQINQLASLRQGPSVPIFRAPMSSFYGVKRANWLWHVRAWKFGAVLRLVDRI
jgi:hypothetical protein